jgi:hypothetical protein
MIGSSLNVCSFLLKIAASVILSCACSLYASAQDDFGRQSLETCTMMGCELVSANISIRRADGRPPAYKVKLVLDGVKLTCPDPVVSDYHTEGVYNCADLVGLAIQPLTLCPMSEGNFPDLHLKCPVDRDYEEFIHIHDLPTRILVTLWQGKKKVAERTFYPNYQLTYPNGERCGHPCKFWREIWQLD